MIVDKGLNPSPLQDLMSTAGMVSTIDGAISGVFAGVVATSAIGSGMALGVVVGMLAFAASIFMLRRYHVRAWAAAEQRLTILFPDARGV